MTILFYITVAFLQCLAFLFDTDYHTVNIWFYCIIGPLVFLSLTAILWIETACSLISNHSAMPLANNLLLAASLLCIAIAMAYVATTALPVFQSLAAGNKHRLFQNCVDYLNATRGGVSYININVWYFCFIGPLMFLALIFLDIAGLHHFSPRWIAIFSEPHAWRYWLNVLVIGGSMVCSVCALNMLKKYVLL